MRDRRYRVAVEFCGRIKPRFVVRFCDEWVGQSDTRGGAELIRQAHVAERARQLEGVI